MRSRHDLVLDDMAWQYVNVCLAWKRLLIADQNLQSNYADAVDFNLIPEDKRVQVYHLTKESLFRLEELPDLISVGEKLGDIEERLSGIVGLRAKRFLERVKSSRALVEAQSSGQSIPLGEMVQRVYGVALKPAELEAGKTWLSADDPLEKAIQDHLEKASLLKDITATPPSEKSIRSAIEAGMSKLAEMLGTEIPPYRVVFGTNLQMGSSNPACITTDDNGQLVVYINLTSSMMAAPGAGIKTPLHEATHAIQLSAKDADPENLVLPNPGPFSPWHEGWSDMLPLLVPSIASQLPPEAIACAHLSAARSLTWLAAVRVGLSLQFENKSTDEIVEAISPHVFKRMPADLYGRKDVAKYEQGRKDMLKSFLTGSSSIYTISYALGTAALTGLDPKKFAQLNSEQLRPLLTQPMTLSEMVDATRKLGDQSVIASSVTFHAREIGLQ